MALLLALAFVFQAGTGIQPIVATPSLVPPYLALADAYVHQAQPALALQVLRAGLTAVPKSVELQSRLAEVERLR